MKLTSSLGSWLVLLPQVEELLILPLLACVLSHRSLQHSNADLVRVDTACSGIYQDAMYSKDTVDRRVTTLKYANYTAVSTAKSMLVGRVLKRCCPLKRLVMRS